MSATTLAHVVREAARAHPDRIALRCEGEAISYAELDRRVDAGARAMRGHGIGAGDRVVVAGGVRPGTVVAQYAVARAGAVAVMVNPAWSRAEIDQAVALTGPRGLVADGSLPDADAYGPDLVRFTIEADRAGWHRLAGDADVSAEPEGPTPASTADVLYVFSSGTTGLPKAVRHHHASLLANVRSWVECGGLTSADRLQLFLPLFHTYGTVVVASSLLAGATASLLPTYDLDVVLRQFAEERITVGFGATPVFASMAARPDLGDHDLSSLRYLVWGATPIVRETARQITRRTGTAWLAAYGASEAPVLTSTGVLDGAAENLGTAGRTVPGMALSIADLETSAELPVGSEGEILVRGPAVMQGYLPAEANADAFTEDGWFRTGDVGWLDPDGWLRITDRVKEMLKVSGFQVSPVELERVLFEHPDVADCAVYGLPDERLGEIPAAAVVPAGGATVEPEQLLSWFEPRLARYKRLRRVRIVPEIPRNPSGKVLRRVLRDRDAGDPAEEIVR